MTIPFYKYQGAGNDFIIIDERESEYFQNNAESHTTISWLCNRKFGIGADGLMLLRKHKEFDFQMVYFNSDGFEGSMCGNGGRCLVAFAAHKQIIRDTTTFMAIDGLHKAEIKQSAGSSMIVSLQMKDVSEIKPIDEGLFLDTGSPHYVLFTNDLAGIDVYTTGKRYRNSNLFGNGGANVNFAQLINNVIHIRTFERGVEAETLACGTGITATAIAAYHKGLITTSQQIPFKALGGDLSVSFQTDQPGLYKDVFLEGPAQKVFKGEIQM